MHKTWDLIKSLIGYQSNVKNNSFSFFNDKDELLTPADITNEFNHHFSIGKNIASSILTTNDNISTSFPNFSQLQSMSLFPTSPLEVINTSGSLKASHSCGVDDVDPCIAHEFISLVADLLSSIFNSSFRTGLIPCELKSAKVIPLYKSGDRDNFSNYRPTSILPYFSKFIEKIVHDRLYDYFEKLYFLNKLRLTR